ncbi:flagellar assembly protein FliH [bacterium endosymbiont of Escarpia laminata]|nr:MAG: flagellar assembly protein FliH [bacterium endosymbiont of Escarpia laminata]
MRVRLCLEAVVKSSSKILSDKETETVRQWLPPDVGGGGSSQTFQKTIQPPEAPPTAAELEAVQQQAYEEGFEKGKEEGFEFGHREGLEQGRDQLREYAMQMDRLLSTLDQPLQNLDNKVEDELVTLVIAMVRQLVRREVNSDPGQIVGVVREALALLPVSSRNVRLQLHPEDAELVRDIYSLGENDLGWKIIEDPVVNRGGCKVVTDTSQIDATLESRLANLIAPLLAGTRTIDEEEVE